jgi:CheY-like chemotaxis protein
MRTKFFRERILLLNSKAQNMTEQQTIREHSYEDLIEEVFIKPIRTVVVVDDEFPTLHSLLTKKIPANTADYKQIAAEKVLEIIDFCKDKGRRWMVEVHDSAPKAEDAEEAASNMHQSDLMVLDFHLDRTRPEEGIEAIRVLRNLAQNDHFNLVIVYTKGYETRGGDIERVAQEIAVGLNSADRRLILAERAVMALQTQIDEWSDKDEHIEEKIIDALDDGTYARVRTLTSIGPDAIDWDAICELREFEQLRALHDDAPEAVKRNLTFKKLVKWSLHTHQASIQQRLSTTPLGQVSFDLNGANMTNWIRTERLFVTVVSKEHKPSVLPEKLLEALRFWNPEPHRLLMSKMRATLEKIGVLAEDEVLSNRHLQAGWLSEYLIEEASERHAKVDSTISKHWEGLGDAVRSDVIDFARRLADFVVTEGQEKAMALWFKGMSAEDIHSHLNRYACSKPTEGIHLTTGHLINLLGTANANSQYWLCLSPACDLVPGQKNTGWPGRLGQHMPFIAAELFEVPKAIALSNAYGSNFLFLNIAGTLKYFSFTPLSAKETPAMRIPNPKWEQMFAASQGVFSKVDGQRKLSIVRAAEQDGVLQMITNDSIIVAQLRYEYALNLLQRIGTNFSRIGLDFVEIDCAGASNGSSLAA